LEAINLKKVLIHSIVFNPDGVSTAYLYNDIAIGLKQKGFDVFVLTTTPHYNIVESESRKYPLKKRFFGLYYESNFNGIEVYHLPLKKYKSTILRICSFIYWHLFSFLFALSFKKINFVISPSPPLTIGLVSFLIAKIKGAKSIYNVQELYPDLLIKKGVKSQPIISFLKGLEKYIYNHSAAVTTISREFYDKIITRIANSNKVEIIPNFVNTDLYRPISKDFNLPPIFRQEGGKLILMYAGNIGYYQDWKPVLFAAGELINENIEFWIIGEGVQKEELQIDIDRGQLNNIRIFPYQNRELMPQLINHADIHFITVSKEMEAEGFPSKVYTIMASAKPMIVVAGKQSPLYNFLKDKDCAELITENRNSKFVDAIKKLNKDKIYRLHLGQNGIRHIKKHYTEEAVVEKYANLLNNLV